LRDTVQRRATNVRPIPGKDILADRFLDDDGGANGNSREMQSVQWIVRGFHIHHDRTVGEIVPRPLDENTGGYGAHYEGHSSA
jgi:hypothetical protein